MLCVNKFSDVSSWLLFVVDAAALVRWIAGVFICDAANDFFGQRVHVFDILKMEMKS